jgi:hypothetical protein
VYAANERPKVERRRARAGRNVVSGRLLSLAIGLFEVFEYPSVSER